MEQGAGIFLHLKVDGGALWHRDVSVDDGQVGMTFCIGCKLSFQNDFLSSRRSVVDVGHAELLDGIVQIEFVGSAALNTDPLWVVGAELEGLLGFQDVEKK